MTSSGGNGFSLGGIASGMDTRSIIDQLLNIERIPIEKLQEEKELNEAKIDTWGDIADQLKNLASVARTLRSDGTSGYTLFDDKTTTSSDSTVATAFATSQAQEGTHQLDVTQLAQSHMAYGSQKSDAYALSTAGTVKINGETITFSGGETLSEIVNIINNTTFASGEELIASIVDNRLVLQTKNEGSSYTIHGTAEAAFVPGEYLDRATSNTRINNAQELPWDYFSLESDADIVNSTSEYHLSVNATSTNRKKHYYAFEGTAGDIVRIDLDDGDTDMDDDNSPSGSSFDSEIKLLNPSENTIDENDDSKTYDGATGSSPINTDPGEDNTYDSFVEHILTETGTHYIEVSRADGDKGKIPIGATYTLHVTRNTSDPPPVPPPSGALGFDLPTDDPDGILQELGLIDGNGELANVAQEPQDALFSFNGIDITRETNDVDDLITAVTINLLSTGTTTIDIKHNTEEIKETITEFVSAYNETRDMLKNVRNIKLNEEDEFGPFFSDSLLRGLFNGVRSITTSGIQMGGTNWQGTLSVKTTAAQGATSITLQGFDAAGGTLEEGDLFTIGSTGEIYRLLNDVTISNNEATIQLSSALTEEVSAGTRSFVVTRSMEDFGIGVRTDTVSGLEGVLGITDEAKLDQMLENDLDTIRNIFTRGDTSTGSTGVARRIYDWLDQQTKISVFQSKHRLIDDSKLPGLEQSNERIEEQIKRLERRLADKEQSLIRQFARMEELMSQSQAAGSVLSSLSQNNSA